MDHREYYKYSNWCHKNGITIYPLPQPTNNSRYKIGVNTHGRERVSEEVFEDKPIEKFIDVNAPSGRLVKQKVVMPSVWDKMEQLYKAIYEKHNPNHTHIENAPQIAQNHVSRQ